MCQHSLAVSLWSDFVLKHHVLVILGCHNKISLAGWLKESHHSGVLTILEDGKSKINVLTR